MSPKKTPKKGTASKARTQTAISRNIDWRPKFLEALSTRGNIKLSCELAHVARGIAYKERNQNPEFAAAWQLALEDAADVLEQAAWQRAVDGVDRVVYDKDGNEVDVIKFYSDTLLIFLLKGYNPEKYGDRWKGEAKVTLTVPGLDEAVEKIYGRIKDHTAT